MRQRLLEARRKESGFTLIELLIVIVILGVLAGIVVLAVGAFDERGEVAACKNDVKAVEVAVEAYRAKEGTYPDTLAALTTDYLRSEPDNPAYTINYDKDTGKVSGTLTDGGDDCFA